MSSPDVAVIGGGLIGLSIAWRAAAAGLRVAVVDGSPGGGASRVAAGMLAPVTEVHYGEEPLLHLTLRAARRYPDFVAELEDAAGTPVGYRRCGTLSVAFDGDDDAALEELFRFQQRIGLAVERVSGRDCRRLEPMLSPSIRGGMLAAADHQVDNRLLVAALLEACARAGVEFRRQRAVAVEVGNGRASGARLDAGGTVRAGTVVLAAGCWSSGIGIPGRAAPVRPVKGQLLILGGDPSAPLLGRNVRALVRGSSVYLVPRADGRVIAGATVEERGFDDRPSAEGVRVLLRDANLVAPGVDELELIEVCVGLRPGTPDNAPLVGRTGIDGLVLATGHYRNGVLLTPVTADAVCSLLTSGTIPEWMEPFSPERFAARGEPAPAFPAVGAAP